MSGFFNDDDDMKIAPDDLSKLFSRENPVADDNIDMLMRQRANKNTQRARELGARYVKELIDCVWTKAPGDVEPKVFETQLKLLFSYTVHRIIEDYSPNHIVADTALAAFYDELDDADENLSQMINDSAAFSMYVYLHRSGSDNAERIGEVFADLCDAGAGSECAIIGESAYNRFFGSCAQNMLDAGFVE